MNFQLDQISIILLEVSGVLFLIQLFYYLFYFYKPFRYQQKRMKDGNDFSLNAQPPVSVIICSQNESENLRRYLPSILEQDYPKYEVIVVNDGSTDETEEVLGNLEKEYNHLYRTYIPEGAKYLSRKKLAMTVGIKAAKHELLLFTESSCKPVDKNWINSMSKNLSEKKTIVLGFNFFSKSSGLKTKFAAYDNLINGLQFLSLAIYKHPYRGTGRNMAYNKSHFFENKGFSKFMYLHAGADDLFINQITTPDNTVVELNPDSLTRTRLDSFSMWKEMRVSQSATQKYYRRGPVFFWRFESWSRILFWISICCLIIYGLPGIILPSIASGLFLMRLIIQLFVVNKTCKAFGMERFYFTLPLLDFFQPVFDLYIGTIHLLRGKKDYIWKHR